MKKLLLLLVFLLLSTKGNCVNFSLIKSCCDNTIIALHKNDHKYMENHFIDDLRGSINSGNEEIPFFKDCSKAQQTIVKSLNEIEQNFQNNKHSTNSSFSSKNIEKILKINKEAEHSTSSSRSRSTEDEEILVDGELSASDIFLSKIKSFNFDGNEEIAVKEFCSLAYFLSSIAAKLQQ